MNATNIFNILHGLGTSVTYLDFKREGDEIIKGKNFLPSIPAISVQTSLAVNTTAAIISPLIGRLTPLFSCPLSIGILSSYILGSLIHDGQYQSTVQKCREYGPAIIEDWNAFIEEYFPQFFAQHLSLKKSLAQDIPDTLSPRTEKALKMFASHASQCLQIAMVVNGIALLYLGNYAFAAGTLAGFAYNQILERNLLPLAIRDISEQSKPYIYGVTFLFSNSYIGRLAGIWLLAVSNPSFSLISSKYLDGVVRRFLPEEYLIGPCIAEIYTPLIQNKTQFTMEEIKELVMAPIHKYQPHFSYCTAPLSLHIPPLEEDPDVEHLIRAFDEKKWSDQDKTTLEKRLLNDHNQFSAYIKEQLPEAAITEGKVSALPPEMKSDQQIAWVRKRLEKVIQRIQGGNEWGGTAGELKLAQTQLRQIIYYFKKCGPIEQQEILTTIGLDGGEYCAFGVLQMLESLISEKILFNFIQDLPYEKKVQYHLLRLRNDLLNWASKSLLDQLVPDKINSDIHVQTDMKRGLKAGFLPPESSDPGFSLASWYALTPHRLALYELYLNESVDVFKDHDALYSNFFIELEDLVKSRCLNFTQEAWEALIEEYEGDGNGFNRLFLFLHGAIAKKDPNTKDFIEFINMVDGLMQPFKERSMPFTRQNVYKMFKG